jgi:FixJ family two-component response regulator
MKHEDNLVFVLENNPTVRECLEKLLLQNGYNVRLEASAANLLRHPRPSKPCCLLLDHHQVDGMDGLVIHSELRRMGWEIPTVLLDTNWKLQSVVNAMRSGAFSVLAKPCDPTELLEVVADSLKHASKWLENGTRKVEARARIASLTRRELEIVQLVVDGLLNKEIADRLQLALVTVKVHRSRAMHKLKAGNSAELVHIATMAGILEGPPCSDHPE